MQACAPLREMTIGEFAFDKKELHVLDASSTLQEGAKFLKEKDILAAPVYHPQLRQYVGIIDVMEICRYTAMGLRVNKDKAESLVSEEEFENYMFPNVTVGDLVINNPNCMITMFQPTQKLEEVLKTFEAGEHRILVRQEKQTTRGYCLVSQSDVIKFLGTHLQKHSEDQGGQFVHKKIRDLRLKTPIVKNVVCVASSARALDGLLAMYDHEVPAVAVVDNEGRIIGTLSASDLRGITKETIRRLLMPVLDFFRIMSGSLPRPPVVTKLDAEIGEVVKSVTAEKIHRIWIVDDSHRPIGLMSLTDIIGAIVSN